jgi:CHAT domain-containing protein
MKDDVARLRSIRSEIAGWYVNAGSLPYAQWKEKNDELTSEKEAVERKLAQAFKGDYASDEVKSASISDISKRLRDDEVFVDFYLYDLSNEKGEPDSHYAAIITSKSSAAPVFIDLGSAATINQALQTWQRNLKDASAARSSTQALVALLWKPLSVHFPAEANRIWICTDGQLSRFPWQLFPAESGSPGKFLIAQIDSARELFSLRGETAEPPPAPAKPIMLLAGAIDFDAKEQEAGKAADDGLARQPFRLPPLPGTLDELAAIKTIAAKQNISTIELTESKASKDALIADLPEAMYVHLATHGFFFNQAIMEKMGGGGGNLASRNPLIESGIALAGANWKNTKSNESPGLLTAEELIGLDLKDCKLMTLSACDTGRGEEIAGQGVMGLRASIMASGVKTILMSLWKVPDEATMALMEEFYRGLLQDKLSPAMALNRAQQETAKSYPPPLLWSAWILVGEGW